MTPENFLCSYIETALWSSTDEDGNALDSLRYANAEVSAETRARMEADCLKFQAEYEKLIAPLDDSVLRSFPESHIAHDFWLTRNHHGAGFWDGDYPEPLAKQLTDLAHSFGESDLYVGDDGNIHI